jgi:ABC-type multidrug transport system fused ATPase/permease subunit
VSSGEILLDGKNIKEYNIDTLRASFGLVSQEPFLFNNTIGYNIKYNKYEAATDEIRNAAITSNAIKFIEQDEALEVTEGNEGKLGFERSVGVKGGNLSGGQKQRVAIARAVLRNPKIYLFDEATSALDTASEQIVQNALNEIAVRKTSISIAHRISTIKDCDMIFVIHNKKVCEQGRFDELLEMKGVFWNINRDV